MRCAPSLTRPFLLTVAALTVGCLDSPTDPPGSVGPQREMSATQIRADAAAISFDAPAPGDQIGVRFESQGCFHHFTADLVLTRIEGGLAIEMVRAAPAHGLANELGNVAPGWQLVAAFRTLNAAQVQGLDRLLAFYRRNRADGCTTVEHVTLRTIGASQQHEETYTDASCATFEDSTLFPIGRLLRLAHDS
jgi:hypothetical protein